jgi:hypothetical protein
MSVQQRHIDFAQAVVQLARKHGMEHIKVDFRDSMHALEPAEYFQVGTLSMTWAEGRHGDAGRISIRHEANVSFDEKPADSAIGGVNSPEGKSNDA